MTSIYIWSVNSTTKSEAMIVEIDRATVYIKRHSQCFARSNITAMFTSLPVPMLI